MSWEKEISVPGRTEDIAAVTQEQQGELKKERDYIEEENHPELVGPGVSLCHSYLQEVLQTQNFLHKPTLSLAESAAQLNTPGNCSSNILGLLHHLDLILW